MGVSESARFDAGREAKRREVREILARSYGGRNWRRGDNNNNKYPTDHKRRKYCTVTPFCFWVSMISFTILTFRVWPCFPCAMQELLDLTAEKRV